ncbi:Ankyrin repeat domain-containing protein 61, partial [Mortierella sp. NVP85]
DVMLAVNIIAGVREKTVPGTAVEYEMLYRRCWDGQPQSRPSMDIVLSELVELLAAEQLNPRPAAARPLSPKSNRPLSGESVAPSTPFPYEDPAAQPLPEGASARQSLYQAMNQGCGQDVPSVPAIPQDRDAPVSPIEGLPAVQTDLGKNANDNPSSPRGAVADVPDSPIVTMDDDIMERITIRDPESKVSESASAGDAKPTPPPAPHLLPPLPTFQALALTTPPHDISIPTINQPTSNSVLPETASLALANGISMASVVSKLNLGTLKTISTISPPPPGAPPPPPSSGQTISPRVISPPAGRPKVVSPPNVRNNQVPSGRNSKTISPPVGNQGRLAPPPPPGTPPPGTPPIRPSPSPTLNPTLKPPTGPPPLSPSLSGASSPSALGPAPIKPPSEPPRNPASPIHYIPNTTYCPKGKPTLDKKPPVSGGEKKDSESEPRPTPPRPMGFPVVTPLDPHLFPKRTPPAVEHNSLPSPPASNGPSAPAPLSASRQIDLKSISHRTNSPDTGRKDNDIRSSRQLDLSKLTVSDNGTPSPANRAMSGTPSPGPSPRAVQGFFPIVDGTNPPGSNTGASLTSTPTSGAGLTSSTMTSGANGMGPGMKPRFQFDNFYSLSDPYKELNVDDPTDFFNAITHGDLEMTERILKANPYLIHESIGFFPHPTPLLVAARSRSPMEGMKLLLKYGANLDRGDHNGTTVLHFVCEQYPVPTETVMFLAKAGADCNSRDIKKRTPLMVLLQNTHIASNKTLLETMRVLFKYGGQTKVADHQNSRTPLHYAIQHCKDPAPVIDLLLKKGADVNAVDSRKSTPLHNVLEKMDNEEIVQILLLYGADPGLRNSNKRNALGVAAENLRVMSAWFLLENDLLSSAPDSIKKASELCSKADGPDKSSKPLFKNLLSDWQGKEGKLRRIQLAQDCILRVQRTPDMKTIDQTHVALEFLESVGVPLHAAASNSNSNVSINNTNGDQDLHHHRHHHNHGGVNGNIVNGNANLTNGTSGAGGAYAPQNVNGAGGAPGLLSMNGMRSNSTSSTSSNNNGHVQVKELRLAEGVEPLKQTMLPVKSIQQLEKEREAIRNQLIFAATNSAFPH